MIAIEQSWSSDNVRLVGHWIGEGERQPYAPAWMQDSSWTTTIAEADAPDWMTSAGWLAFA